MKILVSGHRLEIGGTQTNAIELAENLSRRHGFDILFWATPGPLLSLVEEKGLRFVAAPDVSVHPAPARMRALRALVRREKPDLIHAWDWWQGLDAFYGVHVPMRTPMLISDMMMDLTRVLPKGVPTTFGTPQVVAQARRAGWRRAELLLPPVDILHNSIETVDPVPFKDQFGLTDDHINIVSVSRLVAMKADSIARSIDVVGRLGRQLPLRLIIAGFGVEQSRLSLRAEAVNRALGRAAVVMTGPLLDPRPAYAAADIVIGMGGSAMRGMAFCKPVVVVGEQGFAEVFSPESAAMIHETGMYGHGAGEPTSASLAKALTGLATDKQARSKLGRFAREAIVRRHALDVVGADLALFCQSAARSVPRSSAVAWDAARSMLVYCRQRQFNSRSKDVRERPA